MDTTIDAITCAQQRKDPKHGAQDLQTWSWFFSASGSIFSSLVGGFIVQYSEARYCFYLYSIVTFGSLLTGIYMKANLDKVEAEEMQVAINMEDRDEDRPVEDIDELGFCERVKHEWTIFKETLKNRVIWKFFSYWFLTGLMPHFGGVSYYQLKETYQLSDS